MSIRTIKVSNVSLGATLQDVKEFFSFFGDIEYVEMLSHTERSQIAFVTFKDSQGAQTAVLLSGATIVDLTVTTNLDPDYQLPPADKTKSAYAVAEQKVSSAGSALMKNPYVQTGTTWVTGVFSKVAKAAGDVGQKTKQKVGMAEEEQRRKMVDEFAQIHLSESPKSPNPSNLQSPHRPNHQEW
ncbi:binding partner of ACD11 1-like [Camellia sinensis]|uniref:binding partner of ACD11 1-like n=1 Tax=Camellia sinensis TaxID=4442 RepID=UPI00103644DF|nr:binding partner of ACD11 1-like [Camellia sinensis]